jgi:hypothetical protein
MKENKCKTFARQMKMLMKAHKTIQQGVEFYDFILKNGNEFKKHFVSDYKDKAIRGWLQGRSPKIKACYYNAQMLLLDNRKEGLKYFEGYATTKTLGLPLEHAWCIYKGKVVDVSWKEDGDEYFGVEIPLDFVSKEIVKKGISLNMLGSYFLSLTENGKK